jgi:hypothetical protein
MTPIIYGNLSSEGLEVVSRDGRYFVRYDAGAHQEVWREDEIQAAELAAIQSGPESRYWAIISLQKRLIAAGIDPYVSNWWPGGTAEA